jgi:hypothetical protein
MARNRETIAPHGDKRYMRRDERGRFTSDQTDVGRSLAKDRQVDAKHTTKKGQGDRGDRKGK